MSTPSVSTLEEAIRHAGEGWLIDSFAPPEQAIPYLVRTLQAVQQEARVRLAGNAPEISASALLHEYQRNPQRVRGFFQALGGTRTPEMLVMAWRIIQGMEIKEVRLDYHRQQSFELQVILESAYGEEDAPYVSANIHDFALFRHIGILEVGGLPVFDGFYALRLQGSPQLRQPVEAGS
jgi:hypothetical protein